MAAEKKYTVLCVDDERDILDSLSDTFMGTYNVKTALSGEEALKQKISFWSSLTRECPA